MSSRPRSRPSPSMMLFRKSWMESCVTMTGTPPSPQPAAADDEEQCYSRLHRPATTTIRPPTMKCSVRPLISSQRQQTPFDMASTSSATASQSTRRWTYDVFLSFRGEDTPTTFVGHLHYHLQQKRIYTFIDDERLERGKCISPALLQAIHESRFAIIVFSRNYASSTWCLDETATIMECKEKVGQTVVPIFYDVEPSQVRKQSGSFADPFASHEANFRDDKAKVERWRKALTEASNIAGHDLQNMYHGDETNCIQGVIDSIFTQLHQASPDLQENLVGLESRVREICTLMSLGSDDVRFFGIWGMGGIGKTTLARAVFAKYSRQFDGACFLADIREKQGKLGMEALQATLIKRILKERSVDINDVDDGMDMIQERLGWKKVLIVLDDVNHLEQLKKLAGDRVWFGRGSRVIITTRDLGLLRSHEVDEKYEVHKLLDQEGIQLFSWHAFNKEVPQKGFEELSRSVVCYATGLPLALKVLGSFLYGLEAAAWRSTLEKLKEIQNDDIFAKLKISFDGLDSRDKKIFLNIACFLRKKREDYVIDVLKSCDLQTVIGIRVLIERSLIFVLDGKIEMHDLIQDMGRHIASQENPRSRVWQPEDVDAALSGNIMEENALEGLLIPAKYQHGYNENIRSAIEAFKRMKQLKILIVENYDFDSFRRMSRSKLVESFGMTVIGNCLPSCLRWVDFSYYHLHSLPETFQPLNLAALLLPHSSIQHWRITKSLYKLTYLNLSSSRFLLETPNFEWLPNLERLNLSDCVSLKEVHPSLGHLKKLVSLDLGRCSNLEKLPNLVQMGSLEFLDLDSCQNLETFPEIHNNMPRLQVLELQSVGIRKLPSSVEHLSGLTKIRIARCENLECLPSGLCRLKNLKVLELERCPKLESLPENLGDLRQLEKLHVKDNAVQKLPSSISHLSELEYLYIGHSDRPRLFTTPQNFALPSVSGLCSLKRLDLSFLDILDEGLPRDLGFLTSLEYLNLRGNRFTRLPESIGMLPRLQYLDTKYCNKLEELPELPATIKELSLDTHLAYNINLADLPTKYTELYSVSVTSSSFFVYFKRMQTPRLPDKLIPFSWPLLPIKDTFTVLYLSTMECGYDISSKWFNYERKYSRNISIKLNPTWYTSNFMGFAIYCILPSERCIWESNEGDLFEHCAIIAKLVHKEDENQALQTKCVIAKSVENVGARERARMCFTYIPFCGLWPESKMTEGFSPNDYSAFEASLDPKISTNWRIGLLYKDDELLEERDGTTLQHLPHVMEVIEPEYPNEKEKYG